MKRRIFDTNKKILCFLIFFTVSFSVVAEGVIISKGYSNSKYVNENTLNKNITFNGVYDSYSWYFNKNETVKVNELILNLDYEVTDVLNLGEGSFLTFSLNGSKFYSFKLADNNGETQSINVKIPTSAIRDGFNELKIEGYLRISDKPCTDDFNTANWLQIKESSKLDINKTNIVTNNILSNFPYPIVNEGGYDETYLILPDDYSDEELSAALKFQLLIGKANGNAKVIRWSEGKDFGNRNIVFIGLEDKIPNEIKGKLGEIGDVSNNSLVKLINSPLATKDEVKCLVITSQKIELLNKAVKFLMNDDLVKQIHQDYTYVNEGINVDTKIKEEKNNYTFSDLGYYEKPVEGLFRNEVVLGYSLPRNRTVSAGDEINIKMRYADNIDFDRSLCTVYVNDIPVGSKKLEKGKVNGDEFIVTIPSDIANTSYLEIRVAFDLLVEGVNCEINEYKQPWALIIGESAINLNSKQINQYYFNNYPAPFVEDWKMNDILFVIPDNMSASDLSSIGNLVSLMGKSIKNNQGDLQCFRSSNLKDDYSDKNLIVYGTPTSNEFVKKINKNLWFKYNDDFTKFLSNEKMELTEYFSGNMTTFQLDKSPFNNQKNILVITSPKETLLNNSLLFLSDDKELGKLVGDGAVIDEYGNVTNFKYKEEEETPIYKRVENTSTVSKVLLVVITSIVAFVSVAVILYVYKNRKNNNK